MNCKFKKFWKLQKTYRLETRSQSNVFQLNAASVFLIRATTAVQATSVLSSQSSVQMLTAERRAATLKNGLILKNWNKIVRT